MLAARPMSRYLRSLPFALCTLGLSTITLSSSPIAQLTSTAQPVQTTGISATGPTADDRAIPPYEHIFVIIAENKAYDQIIGNPNAPNLNRLAQTYGSATQFYAEVHPSEANYIAMLGGSTFGIHDDDAYYCNADRVAPFCTHTHEPNYADHTINSRSLMDQLEDKGLTWKGYFEDIPAPGSGEVFAPSLERPLYAVKHNGFLNFRSVQTDPEIAQKIVGFDQLAIDLASGDAPNFSHIVPNQCNDMHGLAECPSDDTLIRQSDTHIGNLVQQIMDSPLWSTSGNQAIVITWDEDNGSTVGAQGCCGYDPNSAANFGGGHIPTIVITNHGRFPIVDATPYNHYSLLRTIENAFGIDEYLNHAGDTEQGVKPMRALFAID